MPSTVYMVTRSDETALERGCYFDQDAARHVVAFIEKFCVHTIGQWAGQPFRLLDWQRDMIVRLFGWKMPDGTRRFRLAYISVPKKNGKSTLLAALSLYGLLADDEPAAQVYSCAADRDQASIIFNEASRMIQRSGVLQKHLRVLPTVKRIVHDKSQSFYHVLSSDSFRAEGLNASMMLFDELHAQPNRYLWDAIRYSGTSRRQPLLLSITTAGWDRKSICFEQYQYARGVLDGSNSDDIGFFAFIREAGRDDDISDPKVWRRANPSMGITMDENTFSNEYTEIINAPAKENSFRRYRLNQWVDVGAARWIASDAWNQCGGPLDFDAEFRKDPNQRAFAALDLSQVSDITAMVVLFARDGYFFVKGVGWIPAMAAAEKERHDKVPYSVWIRNGYIQATPGNTVDYGLVRPKVAELCRTYRVAKLYYDPYNANHLAQQLTYDDGISGLVEFQQSRANYNEPMKLLERAILEGKVRHGDNPVLSNHMDNVVVKMDSGMRQMPDKKAARQRIDMVSAMIMAVAAWLSEAGNRVQGSVYESREPVVL